MRRHGSTMALAVLFLVAWVFPAKAAEMKAPPAPATENAAQAAAKPAPAPAVKYNEDGAPLPPMSLKVVGAEKTFAMDKLGKPALILFVNSACSACRGEMSILSGLVEKYKEKLEAFVVTVDFDPQNTVVRFPDLRKMPYTLLDGSDFKLATSLGFNFTPATVVADASGKQVYRKGGYSSGDENQIGKQIISVLK